MDWGAATTTSSIEGWSINVEKLRSRTGRPPTLTSCLRSPPPKRSPRPAAARMAVTCMTALSYFRLGCPQCRNPVALQSVDGARHDVVDPLGERLGIVNRGLGNLRYRQRIV